MLHLVIDLGDVPERRADVGSLVVGSLRRPFRDGLDILQRLLALEPGHDFVEQIRVDLGVLVPSTEALVRAFEELQVHFHVVSRGGVVVAVAAVDLLPKDFLMDGHGIGVTTVGGIKFGEEGMHLDCSLVQ